MVVLLWSAALFLSALLIQIFLWKIRLPDRQAKTLLVVFCITFVFGIAWILATHPTLPVFGMSAPQHIAEYLHITLFYWAFAMAHLITYSAVEVDSPSLVMTMAIQKAGKKGLSIEAFKRSMTDEILVLPRVRDLIHDKIAVLENGIYKLTSKGVTLAKIFNSYRNLLGLKDKGG
tara:strand:+ start:6171 stop:6695 length:525 start_codon:yes stop_codon:yes gene_type:complete